MREECNIKCTAGHRCSVGATGTTSSRHMLHLVRLFFHYTMSSLERPVWTRDRNWWDFINTILCWFFIDSLVDSWSILKKKRATQLLSNHAVSEFEHGGRVEQAVATVSHHLKWIKWMNVHTANNVHGNLFLTGLQMEMEVLDVNGSNNVVKIIQPASSHQKMFNICAGNWVWTPSISVVNAESTSLPYSPSSRNRLIPRC